MARCNCQNRVCSCVVTAGENVSVTGTGSASQPYVISAEGGDGGGTVPTGCIALWGTPTPPTGWLLCDGSTPLISSYPSLSGVIGQRFGGNGTTTFGLPSMPGRVPVGVDADHALAALGGARERTLSLAQTPQHRHSIDHVHDFTHRHTGQQTGNQNNHHTHNVNPDSHDGTFTTGTAGAHDHTVARGNTIDGGVARSGSGTGGTIGTSTDGGHDHNVHVHFDHPALASTNESNDHKHSFDTDSLSKNTGDPTNSNSGYAGQVVPSPINIEQRWLGLWFIIKT